MSKPIGGNDNYTAKNSELRIGSDKPTEKYTSNAELQSKAMERFNQQLEPLISDNEFEATSTLTDSLADTAERVDELAMIILPEEEDEILNLSEEEILEIEDNEEPAINVIFEKLSLALAIDQFFLLQEELNLQDSGKSYLEELLSQCNKGPVCLINKFFVKESEQHIVHERVKEARKSNPHLDKFVVYVVKDEEWEEFKEQIVTFLNEMIAVLSARMERGEKRSSVKKAKAAPKSEEMRRGQEEMIKSKQTSAKPGVDWNEVQAERDKQIKDRISEERASEINHNKAFAAKKKLKKFRNTERKEKKREEVRLENLARENQRREMGI